MSFTPNLGGLVSVDREVFYQVLSRCNYTRAAMHGSIVGLQHGPKSLSLEGSACNNLPLTPVLPQDQPLVSAGSSGQLMVCLRGWQLSFGHYHMTAR
jgi:hypothetical protein